ncbi:S8 family serine peptidase [Puniceicoccales bacterium CK1056]|uniref:S8 family serine peptidase n=1 Tax=Oceanipulchritudo coccoides TaxID=2706888 RepID=A0A6B2M6S0_9BACT|nr:S8 family serine peptidase [Oceanipulchritudo coccoides]NDV63505.1 S8 family serine peptidase [Oceanipulchritudo coccoides]
MPVARSLSCIAFFAILISSSSPVFALDRPLDPSSEAGDSWLIQIAEDASPQDVAKSLGAIYAGPVRGVKGYHRVRFLENLQSRPDDLASRDNIIRQLKSRSEVLRFEENRIIYRYPRSFAPLDPRFPEQWHLENVGQSGGLPGADINVRPVWDSGITGAGVTIGVVDEGIQYAHPDLQSNWINGSGYDYNDDDSDPAPDPFDTDDRHGTAVAGISLAASNELGGLGVAYDASLVPLRLIAGGFEFGEEAEALSYHVSSGIPVDIYNNSWGPSDDAGIRYVDISSVLKSAFASNTSNGRNGKGTIYVWAAGNGGLNGDNSNYDGYNASPYTISVAALGDNDVKAGYSEPGANLLVSAPSRGLGAGILTTDNTGTSGYSDADYYENFSGTSAAAPIVSGVVALMLERRPELGWRDVQKILALTAVPVDFIEGEWTSNAAGHWASHNYGFGRVDAHAAVQLAADWPLLGARQVAQATSTASTFLPEGSLVNQSLQINRNIRVQHARIRVSLSHSDWGDLRFELRSPNGTRSVLAEPHRNSNSSGSPGSWTYLSTHFLNELSLGEWVLSITDDGTGGSGSLLGWSLELWGTEISAQENKPPAAESLVVESTSFPIEVDVLDGVTDADGDSLTILSIQQPRFGTIESISSRRIGFSMGQTKNGLDSFSVLISDGNGGVLRRIVQIRDPRPVGRNDLFPVLADSTTELPVLENDLDPDGDTLRLTRILSEVNGSATITGEGTIAYTPPAGFKGVERIQYELTDDSDGISTGWATVIVQQSADVVLDFDGEDDFVRLDNAPGLSIRDDFTVEAWIYPEDYGEYVTGFGRIFDRSTFIFFLNGFDHSFYNDKSLVAYFILEDGFTTVAANSISDSIQLNEWQHVAISYDSGNFSTPVRMYVNGVPVSLSYPLEGSSAPSQPLADNSNAPLYMGEAPSGARAFKGSMGEFRIWDSVVSPALIGARHASRLTGVESSLQFYLPLNKTLAPEAISGGSLPVVADIFEAQRVPRILPWRELENNYTILSNEGNGWWQDRTLGRLYGDLYPWVYLPTLGWVYSGHGEGNDPYVLYSDSSDLGWLATDRNLYPWFYQYGTGNWIYYLQGPENPTWFYSFSRSDWFSLN